MPLLKSVFNFPHIFPIYSALQPLHASQSIKLFVHKFATNALVDMAIVEFNNSQPSVICQISIIYCVRVGLQQFLVSAEYNVIYCVYAPDPPQERLPKLLCRIRKLCPLSVPV